MRNEFFLLFAKIISSQGLRLPDVTFRMGSTVGNGGSARHKVDLLVWDMREILIPWQHSCEAITPEALPFEKREVPRRNGAERNKKAGEQSSTPAIRKHSEISSKFCAIPSAGNKSTTSREKIFFYRA